jgi:hypothetical protein
VYSHYKGTYSPFLSAAGTSLCSFLTLKINLEDKSINNLKQHCSLSNLTVLNVSGNILALVVVISFYSGFNAVVSWWVKYKKKPGA